jgi:type I restriction enzyme S subunit
MGVRLGYKQTEVGVIPAGWLVQPLGELGEALIGLTYKPSDVREHGTLVLRSSNIQNDALAFEDNVFVDAEIPERIMVKPGDVLVCVRNGSRNLIGKTALLDERALGMTFGAFMAVYRSPIGKLASYLFQSEILKRQINEHLGATINQITNKSLNSFRIPISPDDVERNAIAAALSDVDALLGALDRLIAKKRDLKQAALQQLLTGQTRLPGFRGKWEVKPLLSLATIPQGQVDPRDVQYSSMYLIGPEHVESGTGRLLIRRTASEQSAISGKYLFKKGDVVYGKINPYLRKAFLAEFDGLCSADMYPLRPVEGVAPGFLLALILGRDFATYSESVSVRSGMPKINREEMAGFFTNVPKTIDEQAAIAAVLLDIDAELAVLKARRDKTRDLKQAMMQDLLSGKTRLVPAGAAHA